MNYVPFEKIENVSQFFEWASDYMGVGDVMKVSYDDANGETYKVYNSCGILLAEYSEEGGPIPH